MGFGPVPNSLLPLALERTQLPVPLPSPYCSFSGPSADSASPPQSPSFGVSPGPVLDLTCLHMGDCISSHSFTHCSVVDTQVYISFRDLLSEPHLPIQLLWDHSPCCIQGISIWHFQNPISSFYLLDHIALSKSKAPLPTGLSPPLPQLDPHTPTGASLGLLHHGNTCHSQGLGLAIPWA